MHYSTFLLDLDHTLFDSEASETATLRLAGDRMDWDLAVAALFQQAGAD